MMSEINKYISVITKKQYMNTDIGLKVVKFSKAYLPFFMKLFNFSFSQNTFEI